MRSFVLVGLAGLAVLGAASVESAGGARWNGFNVILADGAPIVPVDYVAWRRVGANTAALVLKCQMQGAELNCPAMPAAEMQRARRAGLRVVLKPHLTGAQGEWSGDVPFDAALWKQYRGYVLRLAALNPDALVLGTELGKWSDRADLWRNLARDVKARCGCLVTYAANFDEVDRVMWWDAVDAIGVDAYYPLVAGDDASVDALNRTWCDAAAQLERVANTYHKPVLFTEFGYQSRTGAWRTPNQTDPAIVNTLDQAIAYEALFETFEGKAWWHGGLVWDWGTDDWRMGFTPADKPALGVLLAHWRR